MAYRPTEKTLARKAAVKDGLLKAALALVSKGGFSALTVAATAQQADVATGTVYIYFESKSHLCVEVFRLATEREVAMVHAAANGEGTPTERLQNAIAVFCERALHSQRLAYALIAEPVDPLVDAERLRFRQAYAAIYQQLIEDGMRVGAFAAQNTTVSAAAVVGAIPEALIGPLAQHTLKDVSQKDDLILSIQNFCLRAVGVNPNESALAPQ